MLSRFYVSVPEYSLEDSSDYRLAGERIDAVIREHFLGKEAALRYLSLQDHPQMTLEELINVIEETGTDRYDPERQMSVAHDFYTEKGVELFAVPVTVATNTQVSVDALKDFNEGALKDRGHSLKIDLVVVYDLSKLESVPIEYDDGIGEDAFRFKYPEAKRDAVLGFVELK